MNLDMYADYIIKLIVAWAPNLLLALVTLFIGLKIVNWVTSLVEKTMDKKNTDVSLRNFLKSLVNIILKLLLVLSVISMVGVETTSFVAILAAAGFAIGMALQGSLSNFAGGVLILLFKPFKVGDVVEAQGFTGAVNSIQVFNTVMKTPDNKTIILPNGPLAASPITNFSTEDKRRVDFVFGIGYDDDIKKAKDLLLRIVNEDERILKDPEPFVAVSELADSSVNFVVRAWVNATDYWAVFFDTNEKVKNEMDAAGISIPFPQQDVHIIGNN